MPSAEYSTRTERRTHEPYDRPIEHEHHEHKTGTSGYALTSLITGIAAYFTLPIILHIVAVITGHKATNDIDANPGLHGRGMAMAGLVLGYIGIVLGVLALILFALFGAAIFGLAT